MAEKDGGILAEFEEFLNARQAAADKDKNDEDHEVEIWDEKGRGARVKRSMAKPFLQSLGIDVDDDAGDDDSGDKGDDKSGDDKGKGRSSTGKKSANAGVARKYFTQKK